MTRLAQLIAQREGFWKQGSLPQRRCNPGDLRHGPHCSHEGIDPNGIGIIDTLEHGWEDLERQLRIYANRGMTLRDAIYVYAPPIENESGNYLEFICRGLGCGPDACMADVLRIEA